MITGICKIIDLKKRKVLRDDRAQLVCSSNNSAIYYTNTFQKGNYYSVCNCRTYTYGKIKNTYRRSVDTGWLNKRINKQHYG
jgi:hypothetical protein